MFYFKQIREAIKQRNKILLTKMVHQPEVDNVTVEPESRKVYQLYACVQ